VAATTHTQAALLAMAPLLARGDADIGRHILSQVGSITLGSAISYLPCFLYFAAFLLCHILSYVGSITHAVFVKYCLHAPPTTHSFSFLSYITLPYFPYQELPDLATHYNRCLGAFVAR
jgi:hypothetical protein